MEQDAGKGPATSLSPPSSVREHPAALAYWTQFTATAVRGGLTPADGPMLARLCHALAWADEATAAVQRSAIVLANRDRQPVPNPYLQVVEQQTRVVKMLMDALGPRISGW